jgi:hypothetical protein
VRHHQHGISAAPGGEWRRRSGAPTCTAAAARTMAPQGRIATCSWVIVKGGAGRPWSGFSDGLLIKAELRARDEEEVIDAAQLMAATIASAHFRAGFPPRLGAAPCMWIMGRPCLVIVLYLLACPPRHLTRRSSHAESSRRC